MLQRLHKALRSSQPLNVPFPTLSPSSPSQLRPPSNTSSSLLTLNLQCGLSRRQLTVWSNSCFLLLLGAHALPLPPSLRAQERDQTPEDSTVHANGCSERKPTKTVFFDISIDGEPAGRITMGLYADDVPSGVDRFSKIVSGAAGVSYRRKEFIKIMPNYVQHGGLRSYGVDEELAKSTGSNNLGVESLVEEWERTYEGCPGTKNLAGSVGIIVRDPSKPPPKLKLIARKGKLEIDQEEVGVEPNGTEFVIATKDSPELDASALVIGRVVEGMDVVKRIAQVKTVQENTASPYFRVAKLIGDKRAVVAERGFNRPYSKVVVTKCGVLE